MRKQKRKLYPGDLTDTEWDEVKNVIKEDVYCGPRGRTKYPRREMFNAIFYVLRTGCQWTDLPHDFPPWKSVYARFSTLFLLSTRSSPCSSASAPRLLLLLSLHLRHPHLRGGTAPLRPSLEVCVRTILKMERQEDIRKAQ